MLSYTNVPHHVKVRSKSLRLINQATGRDRHRNRTVCAGRRMLIFVAGVLIPTGLERVHADCTCRPYLLSVTHKKAPRVYVSGLITWPSPVK